MAFTLNSLPGKVLFITDSASSRGRSNLEMVSAVLAGGVRMVQLREKNYSSRQLYEEAMKLRQLTKAVDALLFINDRLDVALAADADGVHLGADDLPLDIAARLMRPGKLMGASCRTPEAAEEAVRLGANYLAVGAIFSSPTKPDAPVVGLETLSIVRKRVKGPLCAIGGINPRNVREVFAAGADFVAVISCVTSAADPEKAARALCQAASG